MITPPPPAATDPDDPDVMDAAWRDQPAHRQIGLHTRLVASPDAQAWVERIERGLVRMSTVTRLQIIGYSFQKDRRPAANRARRRWH